MGEIIRMSAKQARAEMAKPPPRRHKYGAVKTTVDGITFDSKGEADRYCTLKIRERRREISNLRLQPSYPCVVNGVLITTYIGDFCYMEEIDERGRDQTPVRVVEDFKGYATPDYILKRKLVLAVYGIEIREVSRR